MKKFESQPGDDQAAKQVASKLVCDTGFVPVDIGTLAESSSLDPGGELFPHVYTEADMRAVLGNGAVHVKAESSLKNRLMRREEK
jgi:hypothetical protein